MITEEYGVLALKYEFWLSAIILIGGGALMWHDATFIAPVFAIFATLIGFWFARRSAESSQNNIMTALQTPPPAIIQPTAIPIVEQPAQPNAPTTGHTGQQGETKNV